MADQSVPEKQQESPPRRGLAWLQARLPRAESLVLAVALLWTLGAKAMVVYDQSPDAPVTPWIEAILPDVVFFAAITLGVMATLLVERRWLMPRIALAFASIVLGWSILNAAWLITTSVQLQPGVLGVLLHATSDMAPMVTTYLSNNLLYAVLLGLTVLAVGGWLVLRLVRPLPVLCSAQRIGVRMGVVGVVLIAAVIGQQITHRTGITSYSGQVLAFSSHWYALMNITGEGPTHGDIASDKRILPRVGEREVGLPDVPRDELPNIVVVLLESVPHKYTSLPGTGASPDLTPVLAQMAELGVEFVSTRVPIPQTTKAFWATFTGSMPEVHPGYVESILVDEPYESLASILARVGYRSAFFQMSTGTFECLPGVFANLDFDWAWFFENLEDPTAALSALTGDDFRMIEPMFDWVNAGDEPFLLTMITTAAHDPYVVPQWFMAEQSSDRYERFHDAVRFTDKFIGEVLNQLEKRGLAENTIVCVIGDHGEAFRAESRRGRWVPFEEVIRVPWVMTWPGRIEPGTRIEEPISQIDVTPTLLNLIGFDISEAGFEGVDALGPLDPERRLYFSSWHRNSPVGYVQRDRKLVYWPAINRLFEYDLASDSGEHEPRVIDGPEKQQVVRDIRDWEVSTHFTVPGRRFREDVLYNHWRIFSSGRTGRSYYIPTSELAEKP